MDSKLSKVTFVFSWNKIAKRRMQPPAVIETFDLLDNTIGGLPPRLIVEGAQTLPSFVGLKSLFKVFEATGKAFLEPAVAL